MKKFIHIIENEEDIAIDADSIVAIDKQIDGVIDITISNDMSFKTFRLCSSVSVVLDKIKEAR